MALESATLSDKKRLIGLDPGLRRTGWGVIDVKGNHLIHVATVSYTHLTLPTKRIV